MGNIQNAINSIVSSATAGAGLYAYSPMAANKRALKEGERELDLQAERSIKAGEIQKQAAAEIQKSEEGTPIREAWEAQGLAAQKERYAAQNRQVEILKQRYLMTGKKEDLDSYLGLLTEQEVYKKPESIETAITNAAAARDAERIQNETGFTPEEWETFTEEAQKKADFHLGNEIVKKRSQKINFEAHKERVRQSSSYKHTRYQGRNQGRTNENENKKGGNR